MHPSLRANSYPRNLEGGTEDTFSEGSGVNGLGLSL